MWRSPDRPGTPVRCERHFRIGHGPPINALMCSGMSLDRMISGRGPIVDMMNVVLLARFKLPWVELTDTEPANPSEPAT